MVRAGALPALSDIRSSGVAGSAAGEGAARWLCIGRVSLREQMPRRVGAIRRAGVRGFIFFLITAANRLSADWFPLECRSEPLGTLRPGTRPGVRPFFGKTQRSEPMTDKTPPHDETRRNDETRRTLTESDLASERMGRNSLQADDQGNVHNQRQAVPDVRTEADGLLESFAKLDKDERARTDLGKGNRSGGTGR